jgi:hypothetical protein
VALQIARKVKCWPAEETGSLSKGIRMMGGRGYVELRGGQLIALPPVHPLLRS